MITNIRFDQHHFDIVYINLINLSACFRENDARSINGTKPFSLMIRIHNFVQSKIEATLNFKRKLLPAYTIYSFARSDSLVN